MYVCIGCHNAAIHNIYNVLYFKTSSMLIFNAVKNHSGIGFIVDALLDNFVHLHNLYTVIELHINFILIYFGWQPSFNLPQRLAMNRSLLLISTQERFEYK